MIDTTSAGLADRPANLADASANLAAPADFQRAGSQASVTDQAAHADWHLHGFELGDSLPPLLDTEVAPADQVRGLRYELADSRG